MNPLQKLIALAKTGDKRVLLAGAGVVGGGVGLFVYLRRKNAGPQTDSGNPTDANSALPVDQGNGGGGGGGGGDLGGLSDLGLGTGSDMLTGSGDPGLGSDFGSSLPVLSDSGGLNAGAQTSPGFDLTSTGYPALPSYSDPGLGSFNLPALSPIGSSGAIPSTDFGNPFTGQAMTTGSDPFSYGAAVVDYGAGGGSPAQAAASQVAYAENVRGRNQRAIVAPGPAENITGRGSIPAENITGRTTSPAEIITGRGPQEIITGRNPQTSPAEQIIGRAPVKAPAEPAGRTPDYAAQILQSQRNAEIAASQAIAQAHQAALDQAQRQADIVQAQQLAAYNNLRNALLQQQARGNYGNTQLGRSVAESSAYAISGVHVPNPTPAQARVQFSPAPADARTINVPTPATGRNSAPAPATARTQAPAPATGRTQG